MNMKIIYALTIAFVILYATAITFGASMIGKFDCPSPQAVVADNRRCFGDTVKVQVGRSIYCATIIKNPL